MKISQMSEGDRPREKMLSRGSGALGNAELVAVLLRTGSRSCSALELAQQLLSRCDGSLIKLSRMDMSELCGIDGIKTGKAVGIAAALELGRRFLSESSGLSKVPVTVPGDIYRLMLPALKGLDHEECWVVLINRARYVVARERISTGGINSTVIDIRDVISLALRHKASAMFLVHNHPSGDPHPGQADISQTRALQRAAATMDMQLLDHIIVCDDCYYSFSEEEVTY